MELNKFLKDLKLFQEMNTSNNIIWDACQILIDDVKSDIEEMRVDHLQGDEEDKYDQDL